MSRPARVRIVEVGPRDGLQNETRPLSVADRVTLIDALTRSGCPVIEAGSFVSPRWVPQMSGSDQVLAAITRGPATAYPVLVPNAHGLAAAQAAGARDIAVFGAASESFSKANINCSIAESLERFAPVIVAAKAAGMGVRGYVSCVLGCPIEGPVAPEAVARLARRLLDLGCDEISLGDTIGTGTPLAAQTMLRTVAELVPLSRLAIHFHDTYGQALANILACLEAGVAVIDSAVAGLGGCPYAKGASGNVASEDVVYMLNGMGIETGIDLERLILSGRQICQTLGRPSGSKVARARA